MSNRENLLRLYRKELGLTQAEAAESLGISVRSYRSYETNSDLWNSKKYQLYSMVLEQERNKSTSKKKKLPLPVGVTDYCKATETYYYVDKTLFLRDFLDDIPGVALFARPRRFGKTLTMDMVRVFFEKTNEDTSRFFTDKQIWNCGEEYTSHQGKYPVIFLSFKDVKCSTWEETRTEITELLRSEFERHGELVGSSKVRSGDLQYYRWLTGGQNSSEFSAANALKVLSRMLDMHYGVQPFILIDEYDVPIQQGYQAGFYKDVILFMRNLFSGGLKDNPHLAHGLLTGILRISQESIFSGLNNLKVYTLLDEKYSRYFGFTREEVEEMAIYYGVPDKVEELCDWYDGYRFGTTNVFNPWSVINYFSDNCVPRAFWVSTSQNEILRTVLTSYDYGIFENLNRLLAGEPITVPIDTNTIYPELDTNPAAIYSMLLLSGYLKVVNSGPSPFSEYSCEVALPNREITYVYRKEIMAQLEQNRFLPARSSVPVQQAFLSGNAPFLKQSLQQFLQEAASFHDTANESFYHGLVLGLCAIFSSEYEITSNRESGQGRFDIQLRPRTPERVIPLPGILIELKAARNEKIPLPNLAQEALEQIKQKQYDTDLKKAGIPTIFKYGVAFYQNHAEVCVE